jgi:glycosyltransferase involved in cell wall biosynthesis
MKTSALIIAHNEEKYIKECISSLLNQTKKPDEIIVVIHNSTDKTFEIAKTFPVKIIPFEGKAGPIYARLEGIKNVSGNIILSIDGDSVARNNWVQVMTETLEKNNNVLVGSWIKMRGTVLDTLSNTWNKYFCVSINEKATKWIWGASFAFWSKDKDFVLKSLGKSIGMSKELQLPENRIAEDYWLALFMSRIGNLEITNKTSVTTWNKETSAIKTILRNIKNVRNGRLMRQLLLRSKTLDK